MAINDQNMVSPARAHLLERPGPEGRSSALYLKVRINHPIVSQALFIAIGVRETGEREILDFARSKPCVARLRRRTSQRCDTRRGEALLHRTCEEAAFWTEGRAYEMKSKM